MSLIMQIWPSSLSVEVRVFKIGPLGTFHSKNMVVKSLPPQVVDDSSFGQQLQIDGLECTF